VFNAYASEVRVLLLLIHITHAYVCPSHDSTAINDVGYWTPFHQFTRTSLYKYVVSGKFGFLLSFNIVGTLIWRPYFLKIHLNDWLHFLLNLATGRFPRGFPTKCLSPFQLHAQPIFHGGCFTMISVSVLYIVDWMSVER
jgi:hypothetical protein